jgi:23S rRNA (guanosine2251-2'-O)-methyltransferase
LYDESEYKTAQRTMVGRKPRKTKRKRLMGSHNRSWLWGHHLVCETLRAGRWPIVELRMSGDLSPAERSVVTTLAAERSIPIAIETTDRLRQLCGASDHQGHLARMKPFPFASVDDLLAGLSANPLLALLDGIQDPHNFGAIVRSAEVLGVEGIVVPQARQSDVTAIVARSSAGAVNHLPLARAEHLADAARRLREQHGVRIIAADHRAQRLPFEHDWTVPSAVIIGNEAAGVSQTLRQVCDDVVRIPQSGRTESLNAAVAAGILFYEIRRQRLAAGGEPAPSAD